MTAKFVKREPVADEIVSFFFKPDKALDQVAGQFMEMTLKHPKPDDRGIKRWFTLSNAPSEPYISLTTRYLGTEASSFKRALYKLKAGDELAIDGPMGDFVLPVDKKRKLLFVAGGIGVTPFYSIIKQLHHDHEKREIHLLYAARKPSELIDLSAYRGEISAFEPITDRRLTAEEIKARAEQIGDEPLIYISGPEEMVETLIEQLKSIGIKESQLVGDYFPGYGNYLEPVNI